eukprot:TRINITY_DN106253_c0_g1_i1.p1 TRINITY_DN106253_c0_g1~~TRINITY_DN106253_c0_g1_i1.p1  ORF type:complete len:460 (-),score=47.85 TRINITY_DN106253_c0_g1_i1:64-1443(-)
MPMASYSLSPPGQIDMDEDVPQKPLQHTPDAKYPQHVREVMFTEAQHVKSISNCGFEQADAVFDKLPAEYWGISLEQILAFSDVIRDKIQKGELVNDEGELPEEDKRYYRQELFDKSGPNMYAVNFKVIRPITQAPDAVYGIKGLSYAVMMNTLCAGLLCDLFLSHAWVEPIFEFVESLRRAWPQACKSAYFCCLSNPQNLDISKLCADPKTTPFYRVLEGCRPKMLMIANSQLPIHSRLWCCYEAFLGYELGLHTEVAGDRGLLVMDKDAEELKQLQDSFGTGKVALRLRYLGLQCCPCFTCMFCCCYPCISNFTGVQINAWERCKILSFMATCDCCCLVPFKKGGFRWYYGYADTFLKNASVNILEAQCFSEHDKQLILEAICGREDEVNHMIQDLIFGADDRCTFEVDNFNKDSALGKVLSDMNHDLNKHKDNHDLEKDEDDHNLETDDEDELPAC